MELSSDLVAVQGILMSVIRKTGDFSRIHQRSGNDETILDVVQELNKLLSNKSYLKNEAPNTVFDKQLDEIVFFLAINTVYKKPLKLDDYSHLTNIMPQCSKWLFVNIIYGLDLGKYFCNVIEKLPIDNSAELLDEIILCLKKYKPKVHLEWAFMLLKSVAHKLSLTEYLFKMEDSIDNFNDVTNMILLNLTGLYSDQTKNMKAKQIYQHMGYTLLRLFDLLLYCDKDINTLKKFIENVLNTSCSIFRNVTVNVFCAWAEIEDENEPLQDVISEKAYLVIEKYQKNKSATELISMLSTIAKKPKTLNEQIQVADVKMIINKINKRDIDQKTWFQALLNTQILENESAIKCVEQWSHLCNESDVTRLLHLSIHSKNERAKKLVVKCAADLSLDKLLLVTSRHFSENKFTYVLNENTQQQMLIVFNKMSENTLDCLSKEITLLILQNPLVMFSSLYTECLKNQFYTSCLKETFGLIKYIAEIDGIGVRTLMKAINTNKPQNQNVKNYVELFNAFIDIQYFANNGLLLKVILPLLQSYHKEKCYEDLNFTLQILLETNIEIQFQKENDNVTKILFDIMSESRSKFLNFDMLKQEITQHCVEIIMKKYIVNPNSNYKVEILPEDEHFVTYYQKYLSNITNNESIFNHLFNNIDSENSAELVCQLLQILPSCVRLEWKSITEKLKEMYGIEKTMEFYTDVMILLCQLVQAQVNSASEKLKGLHAALKYCIQHFGVSIQQTIQINSTLENEVAVTKNICRLLRTLPDPIKQEDGFSLVNILTERSLKSLSTNKEFVCLIVAINNNPICQSLAQKMTN